MNILKKSNERQLLVAVEFHSRKKSTLIYTALALYNPERHDALEGEDSCLLLSTQF